ncbi:sensor histidine kinase [Umezawaea endophytica]|uniref:histidine kinase n=1 Tax=Umezawaea endophytica TaxID=1654476 RepID=A0A9X3A601_9PSEU|nr:histidine kinase [Umezawaea endophytica]MCS7482848.1 histidine kinase [Umezawaea endophytica]
MTWRRAALELPTIGVPAAMVLMAGTYPFTWSVPTALAACLALPLRHRWPWLATVMCLPALCGGLGWPPAVIAFYRTGRHTRSPRVALTCVLLATAVPTTFVALNERLPLNQLLLTLAYTFFMSAAPAAIGALITARQDLTTSLAETARAREAELEAREATARASERARIAREIHDAVGHHATLIAVESAALAATTTDQHTKDTALRVRGLAKETLTEMRAALGLLNAPREPAQGYLDLPNLINRARAAGLPVDYTNHARTTPTPAVGRAIYRVVQEALTNVTKHAPNAPVQIHLTRQSHSIHITVTNTASPNPPPHQHHDGTGLHGLSERVTTLGGTFTATPGPDGGFSVEATLPTGRTKVDQKDSTYGGSARNPANA